MDKSMVKGVVIGGIAMVVLTGGAVTGYKAMNQAKYADVVGVKEVTQKITTPREDCKQVQVQKQAPVKDENRVAGTVIGGVAGGLLGSTIGGGTGKTVATVAGAAGGAYVGNKVEKNKNKSAYWSVAIKMDSGTTKTFSYTSQPTVKEGERVKLVDGGKRLALVAN